MRSTLSNFGVSHSDTLATATIVSAVFVRGSSVSSVINSVDTMRICDSSTPSLYINSTRAAQLQHFSAYSFTAAAASTSTFILHICDGCSFRCSTHSFVATTLRRINCRSIQLQQLATSTFQQIQRLRVRNDPACISSSSLSNSTIDDISNINYTTTATLATSTSLATNETVSSQPSAAANACA